MILKTISRPDFCRRSSRIARTEPSRARSPLRRGAIERHRDHHHDRRRIRFAKAAASRSAASANASFNGFYYVASVLGRPTQFTVCVRRARTRRAAAALPRRKTSAASSRAARSTTARRIPRRIAATSSSANTTPAKWCACRSMPRTHRSAPRNSSPASARRSTWRRGRTARFITPIKAAIPARSGGSPITGTQQNVIVYPTAFNVQEGGYSVVSVRLASAPTSNVTVSVEQAGGDADLRVRVGSPPTITFTPGNFATPQLFAIEAVGRCRSRK